MLAFRNAAFMLFPLAALSLCGGPRRGPHPPPAVAQLGPNMTATANPWITLGSTRKHEDQYLVVDFDELRHTSGREHPQTALRFKVQGVAVLPITADGLVYLIGQFRHVLGRFTWEAIRGSGPISVDPVETAKRELSEETGFEAARWLELLRLDASPGISTEQAPCYLAWSLAQQGSHPDAQESLRVKRMSFGDGVKAALSGEIRDAASVALILALQSRLATGDLPSDLAELLRRR